MAAAARIVAFLAALLLALVGIVLGASTQRETFLGDDPSALASASGTLVVLTGLLVAVGTTGLLLALLSESIRTAWPHLAMGFVATWLGVILVQTDYPNYSAVVEQETANLVQSTLLVEASGAASVLLPVAAMGLLCLFGIGGAALRIIRGPEGNPRGADDWTRHDRLLAGSALLIPFLLVAAIGSVSVLLSIPQGSGGAGLATVLLPMAAVACLALVALRIARISNHATLVLDPAMRAPVRENWRIIDRIEWAAIGVVLLAAISAGLLPKDETDATGAGRTLVLTIRSAGQAVAFALVPYLLAMRNDRAIGRELLSPQGQERLPVTAAIEASEAIPGTLGMVVCTVLALAGAVLAAALSATLGPWIAACLPFAIYAGWRLRPTSSAAILWITGWILWARGNTIIGTYDGRAFPALMLDTAPGILSLWRLAGAALIGWSVLRLLSRAAGGEPPRVTVPLGILTAITLMVVLQLALPLAAWSEPAHPVDKVAVGSLLMSQEPAVRIAIYVIAGMSTIGGGLAGLRLLRPAWFRRSPPRPEIHTHPSGDAHLVALMRQKRPS